MAKRKHMGILSFVGARRPARFIVRLFAEGETEAVYFQRIGAAHNVHVEKSCILSSPSHLIARAFKWVVDHAAVLEKDGGRNRIWIVFDDDAKAQEMKEAVRQWRNCPDSCFDDCKIRNRKQCKYEKLFKRIQVGYMTPCIELWGLMCLDGTRRTAKGKDYPLDRHEIQSALHKRMPSYIHDGHPYFEIEKMTGWEAACKRADDWRKTFGTFPNCVRATRFAGIAPFVKEIMGV